MSNFKIGEKVVCVGIDNECKITNEIKSHPKVNDILTIRGVELYDGQLYLFFKEYPHTMWSNFGYEHYNFRKLDHEFAENLLKEISEAMKSETILN